MSEKEEVVRKSVEVEGFSKGTRIEIFLSGKKVKEWVVEK